MGDAADAYKLATEAGREATKQLLVVTGGLLAGYLAFTGRSGTTDVLDPDWAKCVISILFASLFLGTLSLGMGYLMHAARARFIKYGKAADSRAELNWERAAIWTTLTAYALLLIALGTVIVTAYS
ncbi:hypothetical protein [Shinella zoogloeoides]|uniref:hypothetical protein n=1 Tax=Shinella zoogloeoides TaxID=352475 RepID=UPI0028A86553|nr:hypothetical protein [Shinella zoogloeoides]